MTMRDWKNQFSLLFSALFVSGLSLTVMPGCEEGVYEDTGEEIDESIDETDDMLDDAVDETEDAIDETEDAIDDTAEDLDDLDYDADDTIDEETP